MTFNPFQPSSSVGFTNSESISPGESIMPRYNTGTGAALVSQQLALTYFTAQKTEIVNTIYTFTAATAAGATPTFCGMAIYSAAPSGALLSLLGQSPNDTSLWSAGFHQYPEPINTPFVKIAGQRYAAAVLIVTAAALPVLRGYSGTVVDQQSSPAISMTLAGQSSFPASVPVGSLSISSNVYYFGITP